MLKICLIVGALFGLFVFGGFTGLLGGAGVGFVIWLVVVKAFFNS